MLFTQQDFREAYEVLLKRAQNSLFTPLAYASNTAYLTDPNIQSLLPVGTDGMTTRQLEKDPCVHFGEMERLVNQYEPGTTIPRINFKKYRVVEKITAGKTRKIVKLCLRDQVIMRAVLKKLRGMELLGREYDPNVPVADMITRVHRDLAVRDQPYTIVRTDIQNFYPSVDIDLLLLHFKDNSCTNQEAIGIYHLLRKVLKDNKSKEAYTGLPVGLSVSGFLSEYYLSIARLHDFGPGVKLFRFADDCLFVLDQQIDADLFLHKFVERLGSLGLSCSPQKTRKLKSGEAFDFLGIHFENGKVDIQEEKMQNWQRRVKEDIANEFRYYDLKMAGAIGVNRPSNQSIVKKVLKEHFIGKRSRMWPHLIKMEQLNQTANYKINV